MKTAENGRHAAAYVKEGDPTMAVANTSKTERRRAHSDPAVLARKGMRRAGGLLFAVFRTVLIIGLGFLILQPLLIKLSTSFMSISDVYDPSVVLLPKAPTLYHYQRVWEFIGYPLRFMNSILFCIVCAALQLLSCTLTAYGLARFRFRGRGLVMGLTVFTMIVPPQSIMLPLYMTFNRFSVEGLLSLGFIRQGANLIGTVWPMIILSAFAVGFKNGLFIFMLRQYFKNIPKELEEAAYIDGCGRLKTFARIILPGARPMLVSIFLFAFVWQWNDYYYTTSLTPGLNVLTTVLPQVGSMIAYADRQLVGSLQSMLYDSAAMILHIVPLLILYMFVQKGFVTSIERSGMVG